MKSMDDLPNIDHTFQFRADLADLLVADFSEMEARIYAHYSWRWGVLVRPGSAWIGVHWSGPHKRLCVNLVPFVTVWITAPGGDTP